LLVDQLTLELVEPINPVLPTPLNYLLNNLLLIEREVLTLLKADLSLLLLLLKALCKKPMHVELRTLKMLVLEKVVNFDLSQKETIQVLV
jgi:hypothetical protein